MIIFSFSVLVIYLISIRLVRLLIDIVIVTVTSIVL